ncbi:MAG: Nif3-like dinuclear metal center hexameric protein, partial [Treponema porcinum]|nr:Nif3-like dinuclear metal center hexameric protein [Treponema porcinum]MDY5453399.1 Nif3-like dinuclear metal center hexameric protein [Treponema porcinum]
IAGGHYRTETVGVNLVREKVEKELKIDTIFIDIPTGL